MFGKWHNMSHNKITVGSQPPDSTGNVSLVLTDLSDVSFSSLSNNDVIQYNGTSFDNTAISSDLIDQSLFANCNNDALGSGVFNYVYSSSTAANSANAIMVGADGTGYGIADIKGSIAVSNVTPAGLQYGSTGARFYARYQVPTGQYILIYETRGFFQDSTGVSTVAWMDASYNVLGNVVELKPKGGGQRGSKKIYGYINTNTSVYVHIGLITTSKHARAREVNSTTVQILRIGDYIS